MSVTLTKVFQWSAPTLDQVTAVGVRSTELVGFVRDPARLLRFSSGTPTGTVLGSVTLDLTTVRSTGHEIFHANTNNLLACASCHPEGGEDGHVWKLPEGARRTPTLRGGLSCTEPFHWAGNLSSLGKLMTDVLVGRMGGRLQSAARTAALLAWLDAQPKLGAPTNLDAAAVSRGATLFSSPALGCSSCHSGALGTNNANANVGTGLPLQVPRLVDLVKEGWLRQCGMLSGLNGIEAPLRLMLYPYASAYAQHFPQEDGNLKDCSSTFNGGMDVKLGLRDAYTLDMTLIPDFGQVVSDNVVLNLSPFEVYFNENRQFFTEGTELFQRGGIFYSRRIGGVPRGRRDLYAAVRDGETVTEDPGVSKLINATKVSGRGAKGLGFGVLNAVTRATYGTITDSLGNSREVLTDPLTNYNVVVADQQFLFLSFTALSRKPLARFSLFTFAIAMPQ